MIHRFLYVQGIALILHILIMIGIANMLQNILEWDLLMSGIFVCELYIPIVVIAIVASGGDISISSLIGPIYDTINDYRDISKYDYKVRSVSYNNGKIIYYPLVKTSKHGPYQCINYDQNRAYYWIDDELFYTKCADENEAIFIINEYKQQLESEIKKEEGKKINQIKETNVKFEK